MRRSVARLRGVRRPTPQAAPRELTAGAPERGRFEFIKNCGGWDEISRQFACFAVPAGDLIDQATVTIAIRSKFSGAFGLVLDQAASANLKNPLKLYRAVQNKTSNLILLK
jgi:hypothetical protein